mmetsp:Transcript_4967/g.11657  ORF Transcript_4967/g.11657 Transcript_4967/m.11657 type:complete len:224 (-) Transcript_4967:1063-1734(-)
MRMAFVTAAKPSFAVWMVFKLSSFSAARSVVASAKATFISSMELVRSSISSSNSFFFASSTLSSAFSFRVSSKRKLRSWSALPSSVSQKPFLVASSVASAKSRSISFWMSVLTFRNGSDETRVASAVSVGLPKCDPSCRSSVNALLRRCCCSCELTDSEPAPRAALWLPKPFWKKERLLSRCNTCAGCAALPPCRCAWRSALSLTTSVSATFPVRICKVTASV